MKRIVVVFALIIVWGSVAFAQEDLVSTVRSKYPTPLPWNQAPAVLTEIAQTLNTQTGTFVYGLLYKAAGNRCGDFACDIICRTDGWHWDVFGDGPDGPSNELPNGRAGRSEPHFNLVAYSADDPNVIAGLHRAGEPFLVDPTRCKVPAPSSTPIPAPPAPPVPVPTPIPTPSPAPVACDLSPLLIQFANLRVTCAALETGQVDQGKQLSALSEALKQHDQNTKSWLSKYWPQVTTGGTAAALTGILTWLATRNSGPPAPAK